MKRYTKHITIPCISLQLCAALFALDRETVKIMPFVKSKSACVKCHKTKKIDYKIKNPAESCDTHCISCHKNTEKHHSTGMRLDQELTKAFRLTDKKKMGCITCHDLRTKRFDGTSWRAESLFDKIFSGKDQYKTYYLIIKNNNGQLCRKCH